MKIRKSHLFVLIGLCLILASIACNIIDGLCVECVPCEGCPPVMDTQFYGQLTDQAATKTATARPSVTAPAPSPTVTK